MRTLDPGLLEYLRRVDSQLGRGVRAGRRRRMEPMEGMQ